MSIKRWVFQDVDESKVKLFEKELGLSHLAACSLAACGIDSVVEARQFLDFDYVIEEPYKLADIEKAAARITDAVDSGEKIAIFGDYDVDGVASTALMYQYLTSIGGDVIYFLPTREGDGYGLNESAIIDIKKHGVSLIITVDNGVCAHDAVDAANEREIDVIVCDHHKTLDILPDAYAVIDPHRSDDESSFKHLAGVGVALKLACAIEGSTMDEMIDIFGDLVALGTVSDVMPLKGENRIIVSRGLEMIQETDNLGLLALMREAGLANKQITAWDIAFVMAPRLNAAGRMGNALTALELLLAQDEERAQELAEELCELNRQRQKIEQEMLAEVMNNIILHPEIIRQQILVIASKNFNSGVAGIVCSRVVERFGRPTLIISIDGDEAKGSGRSVGGFSLYNAINSCGELFDNYGGHDMAVGFSIKADRIDELSKRLHDYCMSLEDDVPFRTLKLAASVDLGDLVEHEVEELRRLAPFGCANEEPIFAVMNAQLTEISALHDEHTRFTFRKNGKCFKAVLFCTPPGALVYRVGDFVDIALVLSIYTSPAGRSYVSSKVKAIKPSSFLDESLDSVRTYDRMCYGHELSDSEAAKICPTRAEIGKVYRVIQKETVPAFDREYLCYRCRDLNPGKSIVAMSVLMELGLIYGKCEGNGRRLYASENPEKKNLEDSKLYHELLKHIEGKAAI